ncbi:hypothetical protein, partial [Methanococcus voltae]
MISVEEPTQHTTINNELAEFGEDANIVISILKLCKNKNFLAQGLYDAFINNKKYDKSYSTLNRLILKLENKGYIQRAPLRGYLTTQEGITLLLDNCDSTSATLQKSNNNNKFTGFNDKRNWTFKK